MIIVAFTCFRIAFMFAMFMVFARSFLDSGVAVC